MKFIIQNKFPKYDFEFELWMAQDYYKWYYPNDEFIIDVYGEIEPTSSHCPVGSVEFVTDYYRTYWGINIAPINVPNCFINNMYFVGRDIINYEPNMDISFLNDDTLHIKSNENIKQEFTDCWKNHKCQLSETLYDIDSEYRCFVLNNRLIGMNNYSGDFTIFPNVDKIKEMIDYYRDYAPVSYTLDVMIRNNDTYIVEVHAFFSCGLYGFNSVKYPIMLYRWFYNRVKDLQWQKH